MAANAGIDVSRHVPHVGDVGDNLRHSAARAEGVFRSFIIPQVVPVVMRRVHRLGTKDLIQQSVDRQKTADLRAAIAIFPQLKRERGALEIVGIFVKQLNRA